MSRRTKNAERHFAESLRKDFHPKVETIITRKEQQRRVNQLGWLFFAILMSVIPLAILMDCMRVV